MPNDVAAGVQFFQQPEVRQGELGIKFSSSPLEVCYSAGTQLSVGLYSANRGGNFLGVGSQIALIDDAVPVWAITSTKSRYQASRRGHRATVDNVISPADKRAPV